MWRAGGSLESLLKVRLATARVLVDSKHLVGRQRKAPAEAKWGTEESILVRCS
jgi:hypothetical protein